MRFKGFIGPAYTLKSVNVDCQRCVNLYPELNEMGSGKEGEIAALLSTPGLIEVADFGSGPIRLIHVDPSNRVFVISGSELFQVTYVSSTSWSFNKIGNLESLTGIVSAASIQIGLDTITVFVDGVNNYAFRDLSSIITFGTFSSFSYFPIPTASHIVYIDGYLIFNKADSNQFYVTDYNSISINPLSFASAEGNPDSIVAIISNHRDLWLMNERTIELFTNTGNADFPFERVQGGFIEKGCVAKFSVAKIEGTIFWLGRDESGQGIVYAAQNLSPQRISTHAIETAIQTYADISLATSYTYQSGGHVFYVLNFPEATWVYDLTTKLWHERALTTQGALSRHIGDVHAFSQLNSKHLVGGYNNSKLYVMSDDCYWDGDVEITRLRTSPHISNGNLKLFCSKFMLDMETGVGLASGQGSNPQVVMTFSDDGGHTWSNESWTSAGGQVGGIGDYKKRVIWRRLGSFRDRVFSVKITDPVKVTLIGAELDMQPGNS